MLCRWLFNGRLLDGDLRDALRRMPRPQLADLAHLAAGRRVLEFLHVDHVGEGATELSRIESVALVWAFGALPRVARGSALRAIEPRIHVADFAPVAVSSRPLNAALNGGAPQAGFILKLFDRDRDDGSDRALRLWPAAAHLKRIQRELPDMRRSAGICDYNE